MTKKVRCPHCKEVNTIDVNEILSQNEQVIFKNLPPLKQSDSKQPETIAVTCHNCKQQFKIKTFQKEMSNVLKQYPINVVTQILLEEYGIQTVKHTKEELATLIELLKRVQELRDE